MPTAVATHDVNARVWGLLQDLASIQTSKQKRFGYKRAASAVFWLDTPLDALQQPDGGLPRIRGLGPASMRVVRDVLESGGSPAVDRAVADSGRDIDVRRRRSLRHAFLSRAQVLRILREAHRPPAPAPYRGDLQMHTSWSDGSASVEEMVAAAGARGWEYCAITDHARGLAIAGGLPAHRVRAQQREIAALNRRGGPCRALAAIEANIAADGSVDLYADDGLRFDLAIAAPHSRLRTTEDQTTRLLGAIRMPGVHVLAHPRGRMAGSRAGLVADWPAVFDAAAAHQVAVELDGDPARQDLDHTLAAVALRAGCVFALDSDAHAPDQLIYSETALAHARLAGIPSARVINTWPLDRLLAWVRDR
jgi:histidinol phosphatase-like PHP family hydrolase